MTPKSETSNGGSSAAVAETPSASNPERERVFNAYRQFGYLEGDLDPIGFLRPRETPELERDGEYAREARAIYSSTIGVEINHIYKPERRRWIFDRMESPLQGFEVREKDQQRILDLLIRADIFEQVMQQRYLGSKRFSLEGTTALIPLVDEVLDTAARLGAIELVMGMSHRGRLNVMAHVARRPPQEIFAGFEDVDPRSVLGSGDVKYHMGATGEYQTRSGGKVHIHLVSNPSHLEAVDPVTVGRTRAKQDRTGAGGREKYLPLLVHGDAAFAGQGILAETMNYADLPGYTVGGTIHVVVNNLLEMCIRDRIVIIGENRTFDHVYGTFKPKHGQSVANLFSRRIVNADGTPGINYELSTQYSAVDSGLYEISPGSKYAYFNIPAPETAGAPTAPSDTDPAPFVTLSLAKLAEPDLAPAYNKYLLTGATGLPHSVPDTRIPEVERCV